MRRFKNTVLPRKPAHTTNMRAIAKRQHARNMTVARSNRRNAPRPAQVNAGMPDECSATSCNSMWGMNRIKATGEILFNRCCSAYQQRKLNMALWQHADSRSHSARYTADQLHICCIPRQHLV
jgi:hypothetical protein